MNIKPKAFVLREGFWWSSSEANKLFPKVQARKKHWKGQRTFLSMLEFVEGKATKTAYRGWSTCRCCGENNGSAEFSLSMFGLQAVWPSGYAHYVKDHNVQPPLAFQDFIQEAYANLKDDN